MNPGPAIDGEFVTAEILHSFEQMPWIMRPDRSWAAATAASIMNQDANYVGVYGVAFGGGFRSKTLLILTANGIHIAMGGPTGPQSTTFLPAVAGITTYLHPRTSYEDSRDLSVVSSSGLIEVSRVHFNSATRFHESVKQLIVWWNRSGRDVPLLCLAIDDITSGQGVLTAGDLPGGLISIGQDDIAFCALPTFRITILSRSDVADLSIQAHSHIPPTLRLIGADWHLEGTVLLTDYNDLESRLNEALNAPRYARANGENKRSTSTTDENFDLLVKTANQLRELAALVDSGEINHQEIGRASCRERV